MRNHTELPPAVFQEPEPTLDELIARIRESIRALGFSGTVDHGQDAELACLYRIESVNTTLIDLQRTRDEKSRRHLFKFADAALKDALMRSEELFAHSETQYLLAWALDALHRRLNNEARYEESGQIRVIGEALSMWFIAQSKAEAARAAMTPKPGTPNPWERAKREGVVDA